MINPVTDYLNNNPTCLCIYYRGYGETEIWPFACRSHHVYPVVVPDFNMACIVEVRDHHWIYMMAPEECNFVDAGEDTATEGRGGSQSRALLKSDP